MSDFDTALERLVTDPGFRAALAADPGRALAGYRLSADEYELLTAQVDTGTGGERQVEQRTSKASLFGLLSPLGGGGSGLHEALHSGGSGGTDALHSGGPGGSDALRSGGSGATDALHAVPAGDHISAVDHAPAVAQVSAVDQVSAGGSLEPDQSIGGAIGRFGLDGPGVPDGSGGTVYRSGNSGVGSAFGAAVSGQDHVPSGGGGHDALSGGTQPPAGYHTRVDADGDGRWDAYTAVDRGDQGVDLSVDQNHDGHAEFVGHDFNRDGLIDQADTDSDGDGRVDTRWIDDDGDGWLDRRIPMPAAPPAPDGTATSGLGQAMPDPTHPSHGAEPYGAGMYSTGSYGTGSYGAGVSAAVPDASDALSGAGSGDHLADQVDEHLGRHRAGS